ncbi:unnamed protein product [Soboliphyme baturini]|uniref:DNA repair and recombination protein RAD54-like n=1 Tax=Soboliphyme baturini TaxID=241478 RepID=A0A183IH68_9BILA|nr:unnamed protein product [Soboliphyme baturini]
MGLGKSLQCICLLWALMKRNEGLGQPILRRVLIVCPCTLLRNWEQELRKWLGFSAMTTYTIYAKTDVAKLLPFPSRSVVIIGYEKLLRSVEHFQDGDQSSFDLMICDEGHRLKNVALKANWILSSIPVRRRILLTATPIQNNLLELYALLNFVNPGILGDPNEFKADYDRPILASLQKDASEADVCFGRYKMKELNKILSKFLLRRTQDVMQKYLPPKAEYVVFSKPSVLQTVLYSHLADKALSVDDVWDQEKFLVYLDAYRKACNHPSLLYFAAEKADSPYSSVLTLFPVDYDPALLSVGDSSKLHVLASLLECVFADYPNDKVVIASNFSKTLNIIESYCVSVGYSYYRLDGAVSAEHRQKLVNSFNDRSDRTLIFLLSTKCGMVSKINALVFVVYEKRGGLRRFVLLGGIGLNLIGATRLVLYDIDWNPTYDIQTMARIWRDGQNQKRTCHVYRLLTAGTVEERMYIRQISKQELNCVVEEVVNTNIHGMNKLIVAKYILC